MWRRRPPSSDDMLDLRMFLRPERSGVLHGELAKSRPQAPYALRRRCVADSQPLGDGPMWNHVAFPSDQLTLTIGQWLDQRMSQALERRRQRTDGSCSIGGTRCHGMA